MVGLSTKGKYSRLFYWSAGSANGAVLLAACGQCFRPIVETSYNSSTLALKVIRRDPRLKWSFKMWSRVQRDFDRTVTALARPGSNWKSKLQTRLPSERAPHKNKSANVRQ
jgi:hypothetical protein